MKLINITQLKQFYSKKTVYMVGLKFRTLTLRILFSLWTSIVAFTGEVDSILKNDGSV